MTKRGYRIYLQIQDEALDKLTNLCSQMRVVGKTGLLPFHKGFVMSTESLRSLFSDVRKYEYLFLMTQRTNQVVLKSYFFEIRGLGLFYDHLSPVAFIQRIKSSVLCKNYSTVFSN